MSRSWDENFLLAFLHCRVNEMLYFTISVEMSGVKGVQPFFFSINNIS